jgi:divalent metal cation (Fe/Co/Zn/Cd) transporter
MISKTENKQTLYRTAFGLSLFTIIFNIAEGLVSIFFGYKDESLTLFGFGVDSFIEVISALGIAHMVIQTQRNLSDENYRFEKRALRITGSSFYGLALGLVATGIYNLVVGQKPETTLAGVIVSVISITIMIVLKRAKVKVGAELDSAAILADAECTQVCIYMSLVLLAASGLYELTKIPYVDLIGSLALAYLSFKEGQECFVRAKSDTPYACDVD